MTTAAPQTSPYRRTRIGAAAARVLATELARHAGPKNGLLIAAGSRSAALAAALDALLPGDTLTVLPAAGEGAQVRARIDTAGSWVRSRVRVVDTLDEADQADVVVVGEPLSGDEAAVRAHLDTLGKHVAAGGVLVVPVPALPIPAARELARQAAFHGAGTDLILRNNPPLRVHRLRYTPAPAGLADRLAPAHRTSSVSLTRSMNIDSNGVAVAGIAAAAAVGLRLRHSRLWAVPALAAVPLAAFFRDPRRIPPPDPDAVLAASDGRVLSVSRLTDPRLGAGEFLRVAVFLSVLDVHVNRSPVAGRVVDHWVADGGFAPAMKPAAEHNVAAYTVLDTARGTVAVAQRTGLLARRIVHRAPVGSVLARGERFGLIRFGSRTDVYLPADAVCATVAAGDPVVGGETVIARWT